MTLSQVAYVVGAVYTEAVREALPAVAIGVTLVNQKGTPVASYRIRREWAEVVPQW
jgi:hypothetical protein